MLPTFLIIGAMKAGTSSLWYYLDAHPEVEMSQTKELDFFLEEKNWHRGTAWYDSRFPVKRRSVKAVGEASTSYSKHPAYAGVPSRIASVLPDVQLIYLVRDPIERIRSMYVHMVCEGAERRSFEELMSTLGGNHYVELSLYYFQLEQYLPFFPRKQILCISSEDLMNRRRRTLRQVFAFISVRDDFESPQFNILTNRSEQKLRLRPLGQLLRSLRLHETFMYRLPAPARRVYTRITTSSVAKPDVSDGIRERLTKFIGPDTEKLRELVGRGFQSWSL